MLNCVEKLKKFSVLLLAVVILAMSIFMLAFVTKNNVAEQPLVEAVSADRGTLSGSTYYINKKYLDKNNKSLKIGEHFKVFKEGYKIVNANDEIKIKNNKVITIKVAIKSSLDIEEEKSIEPYKIRICC